MKTIFILFLIGISIPTHAKDEDNSWYTYWGVGASKPYYSGEMKTIMDLSQQSDVEAEHRVINLDLYGFYWPIRKNKKIIAGFIINVVGDFLYHSISQKVVGISQATVGPSLMYFYDSPKSGPFLRADLGISKFSVDRNVVYSKKPKSYDTGIGIGGLLGGGYAFKVFEKSTVLMNINYAIRHVDKSSITTLSTSVGLLL